MTFRLAKKNKNKAVKSSNYKLNKKHQYLILIVTQFVNMEKYDTSQLTEFPRFESESSQSSVSTFFNKFLKFPLFTPSEGSENDQNKSTEEEKQASSRPEDQEKEEYDDGKTETGTYAVELEGRSLPNVLRRISSLVAMGSGVRFL